MAFEISRFSEAGLDLLSQISSSKALKIKNIYADSAYHEDDDLEQDPYWWSEQTATTMAKVDATISSISPIEGQARLIIDLSLKASETSDITIRTVVITACAVESGVEGEEVVFAGISDEDGVEVIYRSGIKISTAVSFYFKFNNTANIEIDTGIDPNFVIHSELDRFVSCHALGSASTGDNQTVYGDKNFYNTLISSGLLRINSENDDLCGGIAAYYNTDDDEYKGVILRCSDVLMGPMFVFSDYSEENETDTTAVTITKEKAGYNLNVEGSVNAISLRTEYTQGNTDYTVTQQGDKIRLVRDDETVETVDLGFTYNNNFGIILDNDPIFEVTSTEIDVNSNLVISGTTEIGGGLTLDLDVDGSNIPGTIKMEYSENTGTMMTFGVGDSLDAPNRNVSLSIYRDTIHTHKPLIAESGLQVSGMIQADMFYGDLWGCIPEPLNEWDCKRGTLCVIKATTVSGTVAYNGLLRGDRIVKVDAQGNWSKVGSSQTFQIALASFDGTVANTTPNLAIGDRFAIITSGGNDGTYLAMRI